MTAPSHATLPLRNRSVRIAGAALGGLFPLVVLVSGVALWAAI